MPTVSPATAAVFRVELRFRDRSFDGEGRRLDGPLREVGLTGATAEFRQQYLLEGNGLDAATAHRLAADFLADAVTQEITVTPGTEPETPGTEPVVVVRLKPGVMDPVEQSILRGARHLGVTLTAAHSVRKYVFHGLTVAAGEWPSELETLARQHLANDVIEDIHPRDLAVHALTIGGRYELARVDVAGFREMSAEQLAALSLAHGLALNADEMAAIQAHFKNEIGRDPSDVELETIAQTWSEHCKHKTLTGIVEFTDETAASPENRGPQRIDNLLKSTIARATHELAREDFCLSVFVDNAGIVAFDERFGVAMKVETHNHPSALEPYGGAGTGAGGVIRDIMGTGLGAVPVMNTDVFCFGPLDIPREAVPKGTLHPRRVMRGVISGVRDYGNRMGIPTANGAVFFHEQYVGNPLVYCGCVGLIPRDKIDKAAQDGDVIVVAGGRTGRDGIGGATFSSVELTSESETVSSGAVQIGNAIEEKRVLDVQMQARDRGLFSAVTDCGAGGLSSAVGEMGEHLGASVELARVPLKYAGLSYREIWLSEAQERMVFAVPPAKLDELLALFASEDVDATAIGTFEATGTLKLDYNGTTVAELSMEFLHNGLPRVPRQAVWQAPVVPNAESVVRENGDYTGDVRALLAMPNIASKEAIVRQYDHEVQGGTVVKPFVGVQLDGPSDGTVIQPVPGSPRGVVIANGLNPELGILDPYQMAANAIDEALRNALAVGGTRATMAILDNFSWGNCAKPDRLGGLVRAALACYDFAMAFGTPFISGKDSLNNEYRTDAGDVIAIPPTLLISAIGVVDDVAAKALTMDLKVAGNALYTIGITRAEWGGSHIHKSRGHASGAVVPAVRADEAVMAFDLFERLRDAGLLVSAHDCAEGGLAVALAEMAFAGGLGATVDLAPMLIAEPEDGAALDAATRDAVALFAESPSRFVVEVPAEKIADLTQIAHGTPGGSTLLKRIGTVSGESKLEIRGTDGGVRVNANLADLRAAFKATLASPMSG